MKYLYFHKSHTFNTRCVYLYCVSFPVYKEVDVVKIITTSSALSLSSLLSLNSICSKVDMTVPNKVNCMEDKLNLHNQKARIIAHNLRYKFLACSLRNTSLALLLY